MTIDYLIQNKVSEQDFEEIVYNWLSGGDYTPDDIIENIITEHNLLYLPIHFYRAKYLGMVTASLGYPRTEYYYVWDDTNKKQVRKSRTVIDWRPHSGNVMGETNATIYSGEEKYQFLFPFIEAMGWAGHDLMATDEEASRNPQMLAKFNLNPVNAWNAHGKNICNTKAQGKIRADLPSSLVRNFRTNLEMSVTRQFSLIAPFWVFMYDYKDKLYYVAVDGNDPSRITGVRPENKARKNLVRAIRWLGYPAGIYLSYITAGDYHSALTDRSNGDLKTLGIFLLCFIFAIFVIEGMITAIKASSKNKRQMKLEKHRNSQKKLT